MKRILSVCLAIVVSFGALSTPAIAATVNPTPTTTIDWLRGDVTNVRFDELGQLWAWNTSSTGGYHTGLQTHVFAKNDASEWVHSYRFKAKSFAAKTIQFDSDNRMYATNSKKSEILVVTFKSSGKPKKVIRVPLPRSKMPYSAYPTLDGYVYVLSTNRIEQYQAPLTKNSALIRTINVTSDYNSVMAADGSGNVYLVTNRAPSEGTQMWTSSQSGNDAPTRTFTIDSSYSNWYPSDIAFTNDGKLAIAYPASGIAIFPTTTSGSNQVPQTWYPSTRPSTFGGYNGVDFDANGVMAVANRQTDTAISIFFE